MFCVIHQRLFLSLTVWQQCQLSPRCPSRQPGQSCGVPEGGHWHQHLQSGKHRGRALAHNPSSSQSLRAQGCFLFILIYWSIESWSWCNLFLPLYQLLKCHCWLLELLLLVKNRKRKVKLNVSVFLWYDVNHLIWYISWSRMMYLL